MINSSSKLTLHRHQKSVSQGDKYHRVDAITNSW